MNRHSLGCLFEVLETLVLTLVIFLVIETFVAQPYQIQQQSMEQTLEPNQYVLVDKLTPRLDDYKPGDIVVFNPPGDWPQDERGTPYIKRIIAVAGQTVDIHDGLVFVNDVALKEPYIYEEQPTEASGTDHWVVPPDELFVLGDHRENSQDSRSFGPIPRSSVIGRAWIRYWPLDRFGILPSYSVEPSAAPSQPVASPSHT